MNLSDRHYSKQSYVLVNAKYAPHLGTEIDLILDSFGPENKRKGKNKRIFPRPNNF